MEDYLKEQYDVFEDKKWLTKEEDIKEYFEDNGRDFLDCGQGYHQSEADFICKVEDKFYQVSIEAEIGSARQDYGDRFYHVEKIKKVTYKEIDKPKKKEKTSHSYNLLLSESEKGLLEKFLNDNGIEIL